MEKFDKKVMQTLISLYKEIKNEIISLGEDNVREHAPEMLNRKQKLEDYIINYAQNYFKGLAYSEYMDMEDIEKYVK